MFIDKCLSSPAFVGGFLAVTLATVAIGTEKPVGSVEGHVAVETIQKLHTTQLKGKKIFAMVMGPRSGPMIERGVWVKEDGSFRIDQLPKGEYGLRVSSPGYDSYNKGSLFIDEGRVTPVSDIINLNTLEPSINVASRSRVFSSKDTPHFWVNAYGGNQIQFQIFPKDLLTDLKAQANRPSGIHPEQGPLDIDSSLSYYRPSEFQLKRDFEHHQPVWESKRTADMDYENWARTDFKLSKPLPKGDYVALVKSETSDHKKAWSLFAFNVTDIGLIVKQAPEKALVRAINLETLAPVEGVSISLFDRDNGLKSVISMKTGTDGYASQPLPEAYRNKGSLNFTAVGMKGLDHAYGGVSYWKYETDLFETYFYTERPVYRLGQTVYFKGITRKRDTSPDLQKATFNNPGSNLPVKVVLEDPDNNKLSEKTYHTNAFGTFNGTFEVPENGKTGAYMVTLNYPDGSYSTENFEVLQYKKPEYQVEVLPTNNNKPYFTGDRVKARIRATYYFGAPVANARVKYSVYASDDWASRYAILSRPAYASFFDDWDHEEEGLESSGGDYITEGYAQTDANGEAVVEFGTEHKDSDVLSPYAIPMDQRFKVQAEVTDLSRMSVIGAASVPVKRGNVMISVQPRNWVVTTKQPILSDVLVTDLEGKPVANQQVQVSLHRWIYNDDTYDYKDQKVIENITVQTNEKGTATITMDPDNRFETDTYGIQARTQDSNGRTVLDQSSVWIANPQFAMMMGNNEAQKQGFNIKLDKSAYDVGDVAKVMISGPFTGKEGAEAIVTIEANKLYHHQTVKIDSSAKLVEIPIEASYQPNVYVSVVVAAPKHQCYTASELIRVSPQSHFLNLVVTTDKDKYQPGESITYTVQATNKDAKPVPNAELSLGIVDESIYAIRPEATQDIRKFFYHKRENDVLTLYTFAEQYSAGPDKIEPRVRKDFRDMAAWMPNLVTNNQGIAKATFKLPDNLTTWRATARAVSQQTDVGWAIDKVISTQDILVRLALPRFYTEGDEGTLSAVVHNYSEQPQEMNVTLALPAAIQQKESLSQKVTVKPDGAERVNWHIQAKTAAKDSVFGVKAVGQTGGDALEVTRDILPMGIAVNQVVSGQLTEESATQTLALKVPSNVNKAGATHSLFLAGSTLSSQLGQFDKLVNYPYGCTEQTMSRLYPAIIAARLNKTLHIPLKPETEKRWNDVVQKALSILSKHQHGSGMWGWWENDGDDLYLTSYVLEGYALLNEVGKPAPQDQIKRGITALMAHRKTVLNALNDPKTVYQGAYQNHSLWTDLAYSEYVLSLHPPIQPAKDAKNPEPKWAEVFGKALPKLSTPAVAYLKLAADKHGNKALQQATVALLNKRIETAGALQFWPNVVPSTNEKTTSQDYRYTETEVTALALRALLSQHHESNSVKTSSVVDWLLSQRDESAWFNTKATAQTLRTLMEEELQNMDSTGVAQFVATLNDGSKTLHTTAFDQAHLYQQSVKWTTPLSSLTETGLTLLKEGPGRLFFTSVMQYWLPQKAGENTTLANQPEGLKIERQLYRLTTSAVTSDGQVHFRSQPISNWQVKAGETVLMKVIVTSPVSVPYAAIELPLPSGAEVVEQEHEDLIENNDGESNSTDTAFFSGDWETPWWGHRDVLDNKVVFFAHQITAKTPQVFHVTVRLEMPGRFGLNPVSMKAMYTDAVQGFSRVDVVNVTEQ